MQLHCFKACNGQESMLYFCVILLPGCLALSHLHCACMAIYLIILGGFSVSCYSEGVLCHTVFCTSLQFTLQPLPLHPHLQSSIPLTNYTSSFSLHFLLGSDKERRRTQEGASSFIKDKQALRSSCELLRTEDSKRFKKEQTAIVTRAFVTA